MGVMTSLQRLRGLTRTDLAGMPDDGWRYEIVDGMLLVSPAPSFRHQCVVGNLFVALHAACPPELIALAAPFAVGLADDTEFQPDILVAPRSQFTEKDLPGPPLLAVEVLSPSTRLVDLNVKKQRFEQAGCPSFWAIDPTDVRLLAWDLVDGAYQQVADVAADQTWTATLPFAVTISPGALPD